MKKHLVIVLLLVAFLAMDVAARSRRSRGFWHQEWVILDGDSVPMIHLNPIRKYARKADMRRYQRLVRAVKKCYPIAQEAKQLMREMEVELLALPTKREQKMYIKSVQKRLIRQYTPVLKKMTISEGKVLLKLIDREVESTAFEIVKEFRGGFAAGFWQTFAKLFGNDLKLDYQPESRDRLLEQIVRQYEKGLL